MSEAEIEPVANKPVAAGYRRSAALVVVGSLIE